MTRVADVEPLRERIAIKHMPAPGLGPIETSCRDIATTVVGLQELLLGAPVRSTREHSG